MSCGIEILCQLASIYLIGKDYLLLRTTDAIQASVVVGGRKSDGIHGNVTSVTFVTTVPATRLTGTG